jgi:M6 family metalloprotease-like protein
MPYPFNGKEFTFTQPDGSQIKVKGWGNQHQAVFETIDGFTIVKEPLTGFYQYAKFSINKDFLEPTGVKVGLVNPNTLRLEKHVRVSKEAARELSFTPYLRMGLKRRWEERRERTKSAQQRALMAPGIFSAPPREERKGEYAGLCIIIQFPDVPGSITKSDIEDFCNMKGYSGFGNKGSVYDYFFDVSRGKFMYTNIVTSYYTAKNPKAYYSNPVIPCGTRARELITEALSDLKSKGFDFGKLSVDDQGYVYALNAFYAGPCTNNWNEGLWPHSWSLASPYDVGNGRKINDYQITDMGSELSIATFCHENGHMVCDFPDLYDYGYQSNGVGHYCIMCYGGPDEKNPTQVCAYLKYKAGWADKVTTLADGVYIAEAGINDFFIYAKNPAEYFMIENRSRKNRDISLPASGLAIWHIDEQGSNENEDMLPAKHYECSIEQADNRFDLEHKSNYGDTGDLFSAPGYTKFGDSTKPGSKWWDGSSSGLEIVEISILSDKMSFKFAKNGNVNIIHKTSNPNKVIPDNNTKGVKDIITIDDEATIASINVDVDINHTYQGDLRLTLISPSGILAVLHDRKGGSANDIKTTFNTASSPALCNFLNQPVKGEWTLWIQDLARSDKGKINSWGLDIEGVESKIENIIEKEDIPTLKIPDDDPAGITGTIYVDAPGHVKSIEVSVDITHTYIGDLVVTLVSPQGTSLDLHNRFGGAQDNLIKSYSISTTPELGKLTGESINGEWSLKVADLAGEDIGKFNRWSLKIIPE